MGVSLIIRRIHLYLALFLTPRILMYALSTVVMNHRSWFEDYYEGHTVQWEDLSEERFAVDFGDDPSRQEVADRILSHLGIEGTHNIRAGSIAESRSRVTTPGIRDASRSRARTACSR